MPVVRGAVLVAGRYRLDQRIAAGRATEVWRGTDVQLARTVAVKVLHAGPAGDADQRSRFRAAACAPASVVHEGIVRVFDYGDSDSDDAAARPALSGDGGSSTARRWLTGCQPARCG